MSERWWPAPAKLNLFLHVLGRRADGYHELQTVFQLLDHGDEIRLQPRADGGIRRLTGNDGVAAEDDLAVRAARLLAAHSGTTSGVDISVRKRIPMGGGLGGGSSDAGTTLRVLNELWGVHLPLDALAELGRRLGADVPVFVRGTSAWAGGVGERLRAVRIVPRAWFAVVTPPCPVPTAEVFGAPSLTRNTPESTIPCFVGADSVRSGAGLPALDLSRLLDGAHNDCEPVARDRYPLVDKALRWLGQSGRARLTGTGASVFAPFQAEDEASAALAGLPDDWQGFVARGVDRSPLLVALGEHD